MLKASLMTEIGIPTAGPQLATYRCAVGSSIAKREGFTKHDDDDDDLLLSS
jgi:hypothetical protein